MLLLLKPRRVQAFIISMHCTWLRWFSVFYTLILVFFTCIIFVFRSYEYISLSLRFSSYIAGIRCVRTRILRGCIHCSWHVFCLHCCTLHESVACIFWQWMDVNMNTILLCTKLTILSPEFFSRTLGYAEHREPACTSRRKCEPRPMSVARARPPKS